MTDFELEKLLSDTLSTKYEPSPQINQRIIDSIKYKPKFPYRKLTAAAAALVIISGGVIASYSNDFNQMFNQIEKVSPVAMRSSEVIKEEVTDNAEVRFAEERKIQAPISEGNVSDNVGISLASEDDAKYEDNAVNEFDSEISITTPEEMEELGGAIPTFDEWVTIIPLEMNSKKVIFSLSDYPDDVEPVYTVEQFVNDSWVYFEAKVDINSSHAEVYLENGDFKDGKYRLCADSVLGDTVYAEFEIAE